MKRYVNVQNNIDFTFDIKVSVYILIKFYLVSNVTFKIFSKPSVYPYVSPPGWTNNITEPLIARLINHDACNCIQCVDWIINFVIQYRGFSSHIKYYVIMY